MPALPSSLISSLSCAPALPVPETAGGLIAALADLPDPRARRGIRHRLTVVVVAAICAVIAGSRSYTAIGEWVADVPATTALALGFTPDRLPSEAMIRRLLQALDAQLPTTAISVWLAGRTTTGTPPTERRAIAVDGKTIRGSRTAGGTARHVLAACDQTAGMVLASTDVDGKTNEITRFAPLLDQISDLPDAVITADAMHCQREHVDYLAKRGAHWILTVKANQPHLHKQLSRLPWKQVPQAARHDDRGHGRREIRTLKILTVAAGIDFPHAAQALQIRRRRRRLDQPRRFTTETVYAITDLRVHQAKPAQMAAWIRGHWAIENKIHWVRDVTYDEDRSQIRTGTGPHVMAALRDAAIAALRAAGITNIAAANRHHARDSNRPLALLGLI
ncbi:ISAs1 family transposase [Actinoplanes philippinensis]|uniref:DDE_Tnp_1-associated n=1 Tax=Actinoplanes philippinensis TaxID=35752 RepID=A0A1I2IKT1_9ACTN|nr:ISAs1 family transposase [Actinoplanes philippinensis]GIE79386.1 ISAs1 family transposase [Actinoplanes philippinensis]SFF41466.1 DDE_Tnp_1-associated [Actinoplanes philippinensis]